MTVEDIEKLLNTKSPKELFGDNPKKMKRDLLFIVHPDRNPGDEKAAKLFKRLEDAWTVHDLPAVTIKSTKHSYELSHLIAAGDIADIFAATSTNKDKTTNHYLVKVARVPGSHLMVENEGKIITDLLKLAGTKIYARQIPTLVDSFAAKDKIQKFVNVFVREDGFYSWDSVRLQHPLLDGRHLAWIFKRVLMILGFTHSAGYVHGAVLPPHLLIHAEGHGAQLIGWGQAVKMGKALTCVPSNYHDWYPPEVFKKLPASPSTDLFLAAKSMIFLAGGDPKTNWMPESVPTHMQRFLKSCLLEGQKMRSGDAWALHQEFDEVLRGIYGPPKFRELVMA